MLNNGFTSPPPPHLNPRMRDVATYDTMINKISDRFNSFMNSNTRMLNYQVVHFHFELKRSKVLVNMKGDRSFKIIMTKKSISIVCNYKTNVGL